MTSSARSPPQRLSRRYLVALGSGLAVAALSGCIDQVEPDDDVADRTDENGEETDSDDDGVGGGDPDDDDREERNGDDGADDSDDDDSDEAVDPAGKFEEAVAKLVENASTLGGYKDEDVSPQANQIAAIETRRGEAETLLADANAAGDDALQERIEALEPVVGFQKALTAYYAIGVEYNDTQDVAFLAWEHGDFEMAVTQFESAADHSRDAIDQLDDVIDAFEQLDQDAIDQAVDHQDGLDYRGEIWDHIGPDSEADLEAITELSEAMVEYVRMLEWWVAGDDAYQMDAFVESRERFEKALSSGDDAIDRLEGLETDAAVPANIAASAAELRADAEDYVAAIELFDEAAEAAHDGDFETAEERYSDGLEALPE